nr:hypothetical protein [uncultured Carboxylicivirga sp.]
MKKVIFLISCFILTNSVYCLSQATNKNTKVFTTKPKTVSGYLNDYSDTYYLNISFEKNICQTDTIYYLILELKSPKSGFNKEICFYKEDSIKFLAKNGKSTSIKMIDMNGIIKSDISNNNQFDEKVVRYNTILKLQVIKAELMEIGSEPFHRLLLPYFNRSTKEHSDFTFVKPSIFTKRDFIQHLINSIITQ